MKVEEVFNTGSAPMLDVLPPFVELDGSDVRVMLFHNKQTGGVLDRSLSMLLDPLEALELAQELVSAAREGLSKGAATQNPDTLATAPQLEVDASTPGQPAIDKQAYLRLLPKLVELEAVIDSMTEDEYGNWVDALPKDEFFEFIGVAHDAKSFKEAVVVAKRLAREQPAISTTHTQEPA